jgi:DNA primase
MAFPPQFLDEIRARVTLSALVGRKVKLTRAGREWKSPCPFHKEKTPSFYVNDQKGFFHCFGCGAHGDAVGFLMRHDNLSFLEAVEQLAAEAGLEVPKPTEADRTRYEAQKTQHEILEAATAWFEDQLHKPAGRKALEYLRNRGLDDATIAAFRLGYAPADAQALKAALTQLPSVGEQELVELGLIKRAEDNSRSYAFFRDRIIFPVTDRRGRPVAFGARLIEGEGPKYINSPEHTLFHKGETLYGIARARLAASDDQPIVIAEGYMDVIALNRAGYTGAVAPMGTAITEAQIEALWKLTPQGLRAPILCLDGDNAGQRAAERAVDRVLPILKPDHTLKIAFMPPGEDPDTLLKTGGTQALAKVLDEAIPLSDMLWRLVSAQKPGKTPEEQAGFRAFLLDQVARIANGPVREEYRRDMLRRLNEKTYGQRSGGFGRGMPKPFSSRFGKNQRPQSYAVPGLGPKPLSRPGSAGDKRVLALLSVMVRHPFLFQEFCEGFHHLAVPARLAPLHEAICTALGQHHDMDSAALQDHLAEIGLKTELEAILHRDVRLHSGFARADMSPEQLKAGWISMVASDHDGLKADIRQAAGELAAHMDEASLLKLRRLQTQFSLDSPIDGDLD